MKIDRPLIPDNPDSFTEKTEETEKAPGSPVEDPAKEPVDLQKSPSIKTDSVEIKQNSFYNFDSSSTPKLDPSQSNLANAKEIPAGLIPGVPFREKVELSKTLPDGSSIDSGVGSGDLGFGRTRTGPNHMGIDIKAGGVEIRNQLNDALKLREGGGGSQTSAPAGETVKYNDLGSGRKTGGTYDAGFKSPGTDLISADKDGKSVGDKVSDAINTVKEKVPKIIDKAVDYLRDVGIAKFGPPLAGEAMTILDAPAKVKEVTGDEKDLVRGIGAAMNPDVRLNKIFEQGDNKYVNPDAPEGTQPGTVTEESLEKLGVRLGANTQPGIEEHLQEVIDGNVLSETDPRRKLISNPSPDDSTPLGSPESIHVRLEAKGPDTVNPDGEEGPIVIDPDRPR